MSGRVETPPIRRFNPAAHAARLAGEPELSIMSSIAKHFHVSAHLEATLEFVKRTRAELRTLRKVRLWRNRVHIIDVNKDLFEIDGLGYLDAEVVPVLRMINTAYDPRTLHDPTEAEFKEYDTGRRHCWAEDRVM